MPARMFPARQIVSAHSNLMHTMDSNRFCYWLSSLFLQWPAYLNLRPRVLPQRFRFLCPNPTLPLQLHLLLLPSCRHLYSFPVWRDPWLRQYLQSFPAAATACSFQTARSILDRFPWSAHAEVLLPPCRVVQALGLHQVDLLRRMLPIQMFRREQYCCDQSSSGMWLLSIPSSFPCIEVQMRCSCQTYRIDFVGFLAHLMDFAGLPSNQALVIDPCRGMSHEDFRGRLL